MKRLLTVLLLSVITITLSACQTQSAKEQARNTSTQSAVELIDPVRFNELAQNQDTYIIDVHTPEQAHIPGTDVFIPFDQIAERSDSLPVDKDTPIIVYCRSGSMSALAAEDLNEMGYTQVYDLEGGIQAYREQNMAITLVPDTQDLGTVVYGEVPTTEFSLTNFTPNPLKITRVSTSCGCTSAKVENKTLEPYQSTPVRVSFDPAVHGDDTDLGDITRTIYIETDHPNFEMVERTITAKVVKKS